eukprot:CAMPEP_0174909692 /NCGR_PEP_ID=MMETSP0167-20121228/69666_1 /TAXON_ID=38298 /ORGANISM="Rhodella maculata, Strain CCMP736" /LENGTH=108 /DNA_ID=CAMNT_0016153755 /DNA_START=408 /DNA_END=732 /DNA_ORIENTATION=-
MKKTIRAPAAQAIPARQHLRILELRATPRTIQSHGGDLPFPRPESHHGSDRKREEDGGRSEARIGDGVRRRAHEKRAFGESGVAGVGHGSGELSSCGKFVAPGWSLGV